MARAPLVLETHGNIRRKRVNGTPTAFTRYRDTDGRTRKVQRSGRTLAEAEANLKTALKTRMGLPDTDAALTPESTINQLIAEYLTEARAAGKLAQATLRTYKQRSEFAIEPGIGEVRLREASVAMLDRFIKLTIKEHGAGTARTVRSVLSNAFKLAARLGLVDFNLVENTAPVPQTKTKPTAPDLEQVQRLLAHLRTYDDALIKTGKPAYLYPVTALYVATGARTSEGLALHWDNVAFGKDVTKVTFTATLVVDEHGKLIRQEHTKSGAGMRTLIVPKPVGLLLLGLRAAAYNEIVFPSSTGTYRWPHNMRRDWREAIVKTEFVGLTPKSCRKAVATLLRDERGIEAARDQLGHASEQVTKQHYAAAVTEMPDVSETLGAFFED